MFVPFLVLRNAFRHKLRTALTMVGIVVAIWRSGCCGRSSMRGTPARTPRSSARLITRNADLARVLAAAQLRAEDPAGATGVAAVSWANWFGGVYITESNFFPQFAVDAGHLPRHVSGVSCSHAEKRRGVPARPPGRDRRAQARRPVRLEGRRPDSRSAGRSIPGTWTFTLRGIYDGADAKIDDDRSSSSTGQLPQRDDQAALSAARATRSASSSCEIARPGARGRGFASASTRRSGTRSPRR